MAETAKKIDITQHVLVPKHLILSEEDAKKLLERLNISAGQLPTINSNDPIAKLMNAEPGKIIKIMRKTQTGNLDYYRLVVE